MGSSLGGKQVQSGPYPQHGSIHLETLPLAKGDQQMTWTRGDGMPQSVPAAVPATPNMKLRAMANRKTVSFYSVITGVNVILFRFVPSLCSKPSL